MSNAAIQTDAPSNLLGRVLSLFFMDRGLWSLGGFLMGTAASAVGISWTFVGCAAICTLAAGSLLVANPSNRGLIDPRSGA